VERRNDLHMCAYGLAFGVIPQELLDVYPLSQTEDALEPTGSTIRLASKRIADYLKAADYKNCLFVVDEPWQENVAQAVKDRFQRRIRIRVVKSEEGRMKLASVIIKTASAVRTGKRIR
jgi:hypothetical protein